MTLASGATTNDELNSVKVYSLDPAGQLGLFHRSPGDRLLLKSPWR
jgi:hypothetical protein